MKRKRIVLLAALVGFACLLGSLVLAGAAWVWLGAPLPGALLQPDPTSRTLYQGVTYQRQARQSPRPMLVHIVTIDLRQKGISFLVTPGDPQAELPLEARTTSQFLEEFDLQLAVNGDGFTPWHAANPLDYYPRAGDRVAPIGLAASRGVLYSRPGGQEPVLYISRTNQARFNTPSGKIYNAISGNLMLVERGKASPSLSGEPQPRTAIGLDRFGKRLFIIVVDGRQPAYSEGATLAEMAEIFIKLGAYTAMNLDGGGSSALVMQGANGGASQLNSPIHSSIPGRERPVGNHLGIYARPALKE
ncbi:MAG: phosphodiester glycosidase family protein [Chloroflexota bacterium]